VSADPLKAPEPLAPGFVVRPMTLDDLDAVLRVEEASYPNPWHHSIFERELQNRWASVELVCAEDDLKNPVGHIVYWVVHDELHILNVAVHPDARRRGLARAMLARLMLVCEAQNLQYVALEVRVSNEPALALYRSFGFKQIGRRKKYYSDNQEDAIVMALVFHESEDR
jgi:ribosomal-protein-alanine N-acetyltransferase